jgi:hypothetical protein
MRSALLAGVPFSILWSYFFARGMSEPPLRVFCTVGLPAGLCFGLIFGVSMGARHREEEIAIEGLDAADLERRLARMRFSLRSESDGIKEYRRPWWMGFAVPPVLVRQEDEKLRVKGSVSVLRRLRQEAR